MIEIINDGLYSRINAFIFDIGNTLVNATGIMKYSLNKTADIFYKKHLIINKDRFINIYLQVDKEIQGPRINHLYSNMEIILPAAKAMGISNQKLFAGLFLNHYRYFVRKRISKNGHMIELFSNLKSFGLKIGIATDGTTIEQMEQINRLGIYESIDAIVTSEDIGVEKPNRKIFEKIIYDLHIKNPKHAYMVGDDYSRDIIGAKESNLMAIWVTRYANISKVTRNICADMIINNIYQLPSLIRGKQNGQ